MRDIITEIWQTARRNKLRTTLTGFAVAWGIFMIIVLLGAGNGLINATMKMSGDFLTNSMEVYGGMTSKAYNGLSEGRWINLNTKDLGATESEFKNHIDDVGATYSISSTVTNGENYMNMTITGVYPVHAKIVKQSLICGRFINEIDQNEKRKVLVLSDKQAKELEPWCHLQTELQVFSCAVTCWLLHQERLRQSDTEKFHHWHFCYPG